MDLLSLSGSELAKCIRRGEVSSQEVIEAHINQALLINPKINAIVIDRFEVARSEAKRADQLTKQLAPDQLPIFHGVPCTIKECFALTGMPQTGGLVSRKNAIASHDATTVARLRKAGLIPLGVTNVPELCLWSETYNYVYGRTNNAYNATRTAGGSSGGEAAIIAAGASPFGLGSDVAGSLRLPALFNGIFSHKPTHGLVPNSGHFPLHKGKMERFNCIGPLARHAEDLFPLLTILKGPDGQDPFCMEQSLNNPANIDISQLKVINVESNDIISVSDDLAEAQKRALLHLASLGATCKTVNLEKLKYSFEIFMHSFAKSGGFSLKTALGNGAKINLYFELLKFIFRQSDHIFPLLCLALKEALYTNRVDSKFVRMGIELRQELEDMLGDNGVLLFPSYTKPAPKHQAMLFLINHWTYVAIFNVLKLPVTQVPLGLNTEGLPLGVQVATLPCNDHLSLAVALELEKKFGGWVPPNFM